MFYSELRDACSELLETGEAFDVIDVRNRVRDLCPNDNISFRTVKYELYTHFEGGHMPGFVIGTKNITDEVGNVRSVIEFRPDPAYTKPTGNVFDKMHIDADESIEDNDAVSPVPADEAAESKSWRNKFRDFFHSSKPF
jgi:hypothetical protein